MAINPWPRIHLVRPPFLKSWLSSSLPTNSTKDPPLQLKTTSPSVLEWSEEKGSTVFDFEKGLAAGWTVDQKNIETQITQTATLGLGEGEMACLHVWRKRIQSTRDNVLICRTVLALHRTAKQRQDSVNSSGRGSHPVTTHQHQKWMATYHGITEIIADQHGITKLFQNLDPSKACGPDDMPTVMLKTCIQRSPRHDSHLPKIPQHRNTTHWLAESQCIMHLKKWGTDIFLKICHTISLTSCLLQLVHGIRTHHLPSPHVPPSIP